MLQGHQQEPEGWGVGRAAVRASQGPMAGGKQRPPFREDAKTQPPAALNSQGMPVPSSKGGFCPLLYMFPKSPYPSLMPY